MFSYLVFREAYYRGSAMLSLREMLRFFCRSVLFNRMACVRFGRASERPSFFLQGKRVEEAKSIGAIKVRHFNALKTRRKCFKMC